MVLSCTARIKWVEEFVQELVLGVISIVGYIFCRCVGGLRAVGRDGGCNDVRLFTACIYNGL